MLGCDIVEMERIKSAYGRFGQRFLNKILSEREQTVFYKRNKNGLNFLAGRFAAKESVSKSLKTGMRGIGFSDIEILPVRGGAPEVYVKGVKRPDIEVSISHGKDYAIAVSICIK
ncbi:holo-ACP synthase [Geovibrio sp. ADMFC3]